ncbi:Holliday junction resolvase RuvX [Frondihabitans sp. Leaf304]|uniref:Holliday junction resolvase RuvX n=1 Tax=Frondihabitans sp. Leaf304 TaxID=1736329 RepID=UPI0006FFDAD6|nr:Holliday junction resolvase RuvX [Frondihabitans sp. Leaf304]KQQ27515.1 Holliday junction resolvase [Frondihabitans sp. Leaf304]
MDTGFRRGARIGVDVGKARIGVARTDPDGLIATPIETVTRSGSPKDTGAAGDDVKTILAHATELDAIEIVVGLPLSLSGGDTPSTSDAREFAERLARGADPRPVRLVDERLSTVTASSALRASGRSSKKQRSVIDQVAAVIIVQHAIDLERSSGRPPGSLVPVTTNPDEKR